MADPISFAKEFASPSGSRDAALKLRARTYALYGVDPDANRTDFARLADVTTPADTSTSLLDISTTLTCDLDASRFRAYQVEILMRETVTLLDRVIADAAAWRQLAIERFRLNVELNEFQRLAKITEDEIANGAYDYPGDEAKGYADAEQSINKNYTDINTNYYSADNIEKQVVAQGWVGKEPYANAPPLKDSAVFPEYGIADPTKNEEIIAENITRWITKNQLQLAGSYVKGALDASWARLPGLQSKANYLQKWNKKFKQARLDVAIDTIDAKIAAYSTPGGYLNISERMEELTARTQKDFDEAFGRMRALEVGLSLVYGIGTNANDPRLKIPSLPKLKDGATLDLSIAWLRAVHIALIEAKRYDQRTVIPINLIQALGQAAFDAGLAQGRWAINLSASDFPDERLLRLRGVALTSDVTSTALAKVLPPKTNSQIDARPVTVRITKGLLPNEIEMTGSDLVYNMTPIGEWSVVIEPSKAPILRSLQPKEMILLLAVLTQPAGS
jgi:hypothetical protein